ncbi:unnamed protein product [Linum trigynum]|uniref:Uncharacterized protein n=1 Tax=Linum trigynum TaxID=586398 RepID=A0AAV2F792_9ROSI
MKKRQGTGEDAAAPQGRARHHRSCRSSRQTRHRRIYSSSPSPFLSHSDLKEVLGVLLQTLFSRWRRHRRREMVVGSFACMSAAPLKRRNPPPPIPPRICIRLIEGAQGRLRFEEEVEA